MLGKIELKRIPLSPEELDKIYTRQEDAGHEVVVRFNEGVDLHQLLEEITCFARAIGYHIPGELVVDSDEFYSLQHDYTKLKKRCDELEDHNYVMASKLRELGIDNEEEINE